NKSDKVDELANVVDDPDFAALYEYKETTIDAENNVVNVYYVSKPLMVEYTVKYICEEEIDEANQKDGVIAQYIDSVEENTPITIKSFAEVDVLEGVDKTQYTAIPEQNYEETVGVDNKYFEIYVVKAEVPQYTVEFLNNNLVSLISFDGPVGAFIAEPATPTYVGEIPANTTFTFAGWAVFDKEKKDYTEADKVDIVTAIPEGGITYIAIYKSTYTPPYTPKDPTPIPPVIIITTPTPSPVPTEAPTPVPTEVPTEEPTPTPEPVVEVEEPETPEGDVEIDEIETPEGAPEEEELDVEPIDTPQGDLPKTGVLPTYAFIGIGAACVLFGSILVIKRRKEEN
ncbi:MAG: LPXTG cell wall anchor domain-containing protein, partial [Lachnospiraceae bacterium]|nr:LPXTG cell wall anchor domain-containing protein [Lachnospiraceae bacterium]